MRYQNCHRGLTRPTAGPLHCSVPHATRSPCRGLRSQETLGGRGGQHPQHHPKQQRGWTLRVAAPEKEADFAEEDEDEEDNEPLSYVDQLNLEFGVPGMILFSEGENGLPRVWLKHVDSCMGVEIYLHGATLTQWLRPNGTCALDQHPAMQLDPDSSNKGAGLRLAFPVYKAGTSMTLDDGFVGRMPWEVVAAGLTCLPGPDGLQGDGYEDALQQYLKLQEERPEEYGEDAEEWVDPLHAVNPLIIEADEDEEELPDQQLGQAPAGEPQAAAAAAPPAAPKKRGRKKKSETVASPAAPDTQEATAAGTLQPAAPPSSTTEGASQAVAPHGEVAAPEPGAELQGEGAQVEGLADAEDLQGVQDGDEDEHVELSVAAAELVSQLEAGFDPAPYVTLRLTDNEQTRAIWPHKFELLYKITIMEQDDFPTGEVMVGGESISHSDSVAVIAREDLENERQRAEDAPNPVFEPAGRTDPNTGLDVPVQLKMELLVVNRDPEDSEQMMEFEVAALMQFAVKDILRNGDFVKVLGLGNQTAIDYAHDERVPLIMSNEDGDFMHYQGQRLDAAFPQACQSDVKIAPGDGTHYELLPRKGVRDVMVFHPGIDPRMKIDPNRQLAGLGVGAVVAPKRLRPGEYWEAEFAVRWHNHMWQEPIFGDDAPYIPPMDNQEYEVHDDAQGLFGALEDDVSAPEAEEDE